MRLKRDILLEIIYSFIISFVLVLDSPEYITIESKEIKVWINTIILALLYLLIKSYSKNFSGSIFKPGLILENKNTSSLRDFFTIINDFTKYKAAVFIIFYTGFCLFQSEFDFILLGIKILQLLAISIYALSIYTILNAYSKFTNFNWLYVIVLFIPNIVLSIIYKIGSIDFIQFYAISPSNLNLLFSQINNEPARLWIVILNLLNSLILVYFFIKSIDYIKIKIALDSQKSLYRLN